MSVLRRILILAILALSPCHALAEVVTYCFTGTVGPGTGHVYSLSIPTGTTVTGCFEYNTLATASSNDGTTAIYSQHIPGGFAATFGTVQVVASDYTVHVSNDLPAPYDSSIITDFLTVEWLSTENPATPLNVGGMDQSVGIFRFSVAYNPSTFPDPSLPPSLPTTGFDGYLRGFLDDAPPPLNPVEVLYSVGTLTSVPEPSTLALFLGGVSVLGLARRKLPRGQ
jgi:hypothetical protein